MPWIFGAISGQSQLQFAGIFVKNSSLISMRVSAHLRADSIRGDGILPTDTEIRKRELWPAPMPPTPLLLANYEPV
jgi:hypothetical protein